jgi:general secretion pathway protein K
MRIFSDRASATTVARDARGGRGVALLMVLTSIAVLTAVAVDFAYNTRVDTTLAVHARDSLRAEYMAKSALNFGRLVLHFQNQIDGQSGQLQSALGSLTGALGGNAGAAAGAAAGASGLGGIGALRLWELLPVESGAISTFVGAAAAPPSLDEAPLPGAGAAAEPGKAVPATGLLSFGTFDGGFHAEIQDEESKLNLNRLGGIASMSRATALQLYMLWVDPRWDFLFDRENSHRERYNRFDQLTLIRDYVDEDEVESSLDQTALLAPAGDVFVAGFGDEEGPYTRYEPRYKPKNAPFDSLPEVYLVPGVTDRFMAAFGDRITVYPDRNTPVNVNTSDPLQQLANIQSAARDPNQPALQDPRIIQTIFEQLALLRAVPGVGITLQSFVSVVEAAGIPVKPEIKNNAANNPLGDKSQTFTIRATGRAGDVERTLTAVVRYDQGLGKLLYYREE